jgi:hypothetical protein
VVNKECLFPRFPNEEHSFIKEKHCENSIQNIWSWPKNIKGKDILEQGCTVSLNLYKFKCISQK